MATTVRLGDVDEALGRCQLILEKHYRNNENGSGWYHRLASDKPGPTATALGLHFFQMHGVTFDHQYDALKFLKDKQVKSSVRERVGGWAINTSFGIPVVESTAWVTRYLACARLGDERNVPSLPAAYGWLANNQNPDGGWGSFKGQPSRVYLTALALRALLTANPAGDDTTARAIEWLFCIRSPDEPGWGVAAGAPSSQTHTAMAVLALNAAKNVAPKRLRGAYSWLRKSYDPSRIVDSTSKIESYNVEAVVGGKKFTWHNSLPHYSAPFVLLALMTDHEERIGESFLQGVNTIIDLQEPGGNWPNVEGGSEPSIWSVWTFSEALHGFRDNPLMAATESIRSSNGVLVVHPSSMAEKELARLVRDSLWSRSLRVVKRQWATAIVSVFVITGAVLSGVGAIEWQDFMLSLIFPVILLFAQEFGNRRHSVGSA